MTTSTNNEVTRWLEHFFGDRFSVKNKGRDNLIFALVSQVGLDAAEAVVEVENYLSQLKVRGFPCYTDELERASRSRGVLGIVEKMHPYWFPNEGLRGRTQQPHSNRNKNYVIT